MGLQGIATDHFWINRDRDAAQLCVPVANFIGEQWRIQLGVDFASRDPCFLATPSKRSAKLMHNPNASGLTGVIRRNNVIRVLHPDVEFFQGVASFLCLHGLTASAVLATYVRVCGRENRLRQCHGHPQPQLVKRFVDGWNVAAARRRRSVVLNVDGFLRRKQIAHQ